MEQQADGIQSLLADAAQSTMVVVVVEARIAWSSIAAPPLLSAGYRRPSPLSGALSGASRIATR
eukprot:7564146-Pyramimonas_sp.AAC.1